jgi:hypothetical protein
MKEVLLFTSLLLVSAAMPPKEKPDEQTIAAMLDDWYDAADKGDGGRYFSHFTEDAVFMGTDPDERWALPEFRAHFESRFDGHNAWTYVASERHISFSQDHRTGWFDEKLVSPKYGKLRGTGVVIKLNGVWKIKQYSLTFLIPNDSLQSFVDLVKTQR